MDVQGYFCVHESQFKFSGSRVGLELTYFLVDLELEKKFFITPSFLN
jgi:hypothetical protein